MKKTIIVLLLLVPATLVFAQENKFQIALVGQIFSPNNFNYQSISYINQVNGNNTSGNLSGYGIGYGGAINVNYYFYKHIGASLDIGFLTFENQLEFPLGTDNYAYKNTADFQTIKAGIIGKSRISETNFELIASIGLDVVFADFFEHTQIGDVHINMDGVSGVYAGPYIRIGGTYKIIELISIYADYEYSIIPAEYSFNEVDSDIKKYVSNSDLGGHGIRIGLAIHF